MFTTVSFGSTLTPSASTAFPAIFFTSPSTISPTFSPLCTTSPFCWTVAPSKSSKGAPSGFDLSSSGIGSACPIFLPASSKNSPFAVHRRPCSFLRLPSTILPTVMPSFATNCLQSSSAAGKKFAYQDPSAELTLPDLLGMRPLSTL